MRLSALLSIACVVPFALGLSPEWRHRLLGGATTSPTPPWKDTPNAANCTLTWYTQPLDQFSFLTDQPTYQQRVFVCAQETWNKGPGGAIFFYNGNEGDVTLYVNHTGLMWENGPKMGALLVFAEHRFYGLSNPACDPSQPSCLQFLTHEQAQADYISVIYQLQAAYGVVQPVILFGGSYGGMLAAWSRLKYPAVFAGAIAASAPMLAFPGMAAAYDSETYWALVTADASPAGGANAACAPNVRGAFSAMASAYAAGPAGLANLSSTFQLCAPLTGAPGELALLEMVYTNAWDTMAMGNFPYPSNYLTGGGPLLPPFPVRAACDLLSDPTLLNPGREWDLLAAFNAAGAVFNNATLNVPCYALPASDPFEDGIWDWQWCTQLVPEETYFARDGVNDMFPPFAYNLSFIAAHCAAKYNLTPRTNWIASSYGASYIGSGATNIVFSNGGFDPWSTGGLKDASGDLQSIFIEGGAHHLDLFFSQPEDPQSVIDARAFEIDAVTSWIAAWYSARSAY